VTQGLKTLLSSSSTISIASRRVETSDPSVIDEEFLRSGLGYDSAPAGATGISGVEPRAPLPSEEKKAFAKPRGPARRRP